MDQFVVGLRKAVETKSWHAALALALTLPDVCARLETPQDRSQARYARWWNENLGPLYSFAVGSPVVMHTFLTGRDAYALRCSYLHEGQHEVDGQRAREVLHEFALIEPVEGSGAGGHRNRVSTPTRQYLTLRVDLYCLEIADAVEAWVAQRKLAGLPHQPANMLTITASTNIGGVRV